MWDILASELRNSADWRRSVATRHPEDADRNLRAAASMDVLADKVERISDPVLLWQYRAIAEGDSPEALTEAEGEAIKLLGFYSEPETAEEFVQGILDDIRK